MTPIQRIAHARCKRATTRRRLIASLIAVLCGTFLLSLMLGKSFIGPVDVARVIMGYDVAGANFTIGTLRLPRALTAVLAGISFGLGGVVFQTMLRNPLASPDIIGISAGASAAAVFAIVILHVSGPQVAIWAIMAGLLTAWAIYMLANKGGAVGTRLILIGIGVSAMLQSVVAYVLSQAPAWSLQEAMRWMTGSLNGAQLAQALPLGLSVVVFGGVLVLFRRDIDALRLGDDTAAALGTPVARTRIGLILCAVGLIAVATAITGPIAFVAFLSGPIVARIMGPNGSLLVPAAIMGALLVLVGDYIGQNLLPGRYPVGVVTGAFGAPYLVYLIIRANRNGGSI